METCCILALLIPLLSLCVRFLGWLVGLFGQGAQAISNAIQAYQETQYPAPSVEWIQDERKIPSNLRSAVLERDNSICRYCGRRVQTIHIDHVIPISQGGKSVFENLVTACSRCNQLKGGRTPQQAGMRLLPIGTRR